VGEDEDRSRHPRSIRFVRDMHHADPEVAAAGELRSEQVTVLQDGSGGCVLVGFLDGRTHDGTIRVLGDEVVAQAYFGDAERPDAEAEVAEVVVWPGDDPDALLTAWASEVGRRCDARVDAPFQVGWCSWYHYFHEVTEAHVRANLGLARDWPFEVFQVDDGYQSAIGDWLVANEKFPSGVAGVAEAIDAAGYTPGIWIAPFIAAPDSTLAAEHPEFFARDLERDAPQVGMWNDIWGGFMWGLDMTHPGARAHVAETAAALVGMGYRYLKLDFTFSAAIEGRFHDPTKTPAERVRAGYQAVRDGAGEDTFILGCGCPLGAVVGLVDGMRIGPDVAPRWEGDGEEQLPGYDDVRPSTAAALRSTEARQFLHRRLWLNDPDCVMLRTSETELTPEQVARWAGAVGDSGGMVLVSDDLALLGADERSLLEKVVARGREVDARIRYGAHPEPLADG
jgi:alpha-galactosidase